MNISTPTDGPSTPLASASRGIIGVGGGQGLGIEAMFAQILAVVEKSVCRFLQVAELRAETAELRAQNATLERQIKESMNRSNASNSAISVPPSPNLQAIRSPFLQPSEHPSIYVPQPPQFASHTSSATLIARQAALNNFWAVVPAGGAGTRLWPLSRETCPKFLLDLTQTGRSLIQGTWDRLLPLTTPQRLMVVTGSVHAPAVQEQLPDLLAQNLLAEPSPKESAAAIGLAAAVLARRDPEAILGSFAADHMISGTEAFNSAVTEAVHTAKAGYLVTIGIAPSGPATGFGYICLGDKLHLEGAPNARVVEFFKEKPDAKTASSYLQSGNYRWNAGMFVVKAKVLMELLSKYEPELAEGLDRIASEWEFEGEKEDVAAERRKKVLGEVWSGLTKIAIDHAVAERAAAIGRVAVVPATFGWDDLGDFSSLSDLLPKESNEMAILGDSNYVIHHQVAGGIVVPLSQRLVACLGVDDLVIVDTPDALLVTTRARSQELKKLVAKCKESAMWKKTT
ncbi:Xanthan biosynthesis protein XanB Includes: RecName: Full=Mannose-6-phosphate isomerase; AltName: Full=Phosphohexomutase; AltName: Full=Phosphomannose isomerase; Short=PMI; Includes: RecName: Full=Mannose-1-phosphate guanylyl transferase; AltName: Full=GDP-mannose pyrophosphorylase; Short=GMP; Short=GMPP [Serendipita indica DSM 11827]|nr:Xanthan biosynthesis protein XanB Includes: RecName: Full=Mannose-6-phosphate isomerase; AltName: Full=Phosphohexomutase; AltName: Full=Phosphomannose isomerase; Short=PMI; Includes: RecName: Full=Mannose-1-phosphate guanylyl transferase; AltName: Full=GDP-mannose pyrophosphorylase; Short=GMP; Short=GMPP [Serendipita indica DSM 11827]